MLVVFVIFVIIIIGACDYFRFDLIFIKKKLTKTGFLKKKIKPKPVQTDWFRFGYFGDKTGSNRFDSVFPV